jgi:hypothetical protein
VARLCAALFFVAALSGCVVGPQDQRLVSKSSMLFSEYAVFNDSTRLLPQTETGRAFNVGGQAGSCTACR